jgi:hypothetical protein
MVNEVRQLFSTDALAAVTGGYREFLQEATEGTES